MTDGSSLRSGAAKYWQHGRRRALGALRFLRRHAWQLALLYASVVVPLWIFGELADEVHEGAGEPLPFDAPLMYALRALPWDGAEAGSLLLADVGYRWGVVPFDIGLTLLLLALGRLRHGLFFAIAVAGSALINLGAKAWFARARPELWEHIVEESTFSFPSGHAMGSMTLALALIVLCWRTRWRWPVLLVALAFAVAVGLSRVWLGVHYPSDVLAAWAASAAWVFGVAWVFRLKRRRPGGEPVPQAPRETLVGHD